MPRQDLNDTQAAETIVAACRFLWQHMSSARRRQFFATVALVVAGAVTELATIGAVVPFLAAMSGGGNGLTDSLQNRLGSSLGLPAGTSAIAVAAGALCLIALVSGWVRVWLLSANLRFVSGLSHEIGMTVFARALRQPYSYYVTRNSSEVIAGIEKIETVVWGMLMPGIQGASSSFIGIGILGLLIAIDPLAASIAGAAMCAAYLLVGLAVRRRLSRNSQQLAFSAEERVKTIQEALGGIRDLLLEQSQGVPEDKYRVLDRAYRHSQATNNLIMLAPRFIVEGAGIVLISVLAVFLRHRDGGLAAALPILGALALGAQRLLPLVQQAYHGWSGFLGNRQALFDVVALMRAPMVGSVPRDRATPTIPFRDAVVLAQVAFRYRGRQGEALSDIDLVIPRGARIGFVGETGSGKSTLLDIVMGLLEPTRGQVLVDGIALDDRNRANWQAQIAHVPQAIFLADSSIAANIAFGEAPGDFDHARIREAAKRAQIDDFLMTLPAGYETRVGERGIQLSGGQRQRIGIARALYKRASVLVLDEATSALDDATERAIMNALAELGAEITVLTIAHRTSTLARCERIIRLVAGRVVESGTFDDVIGTAPAG